MRIAYSCQVPLGAGFGLPAQYAVSALQERGYDVKVFAPRARDQGIAGFDEWHDSYTALHLNLEKGDIYIGWANASLESIRSAHKQGAKAIIHRGSAHIEFQKDVLAQEGMRLDPVSVDRQCQEYEEVDYIIVDSTFILSTFEKYAPQAIVDKVHVVNLGVDCSKYTYTPMREDKFVVLFIGGNVTRKGLNYLVQAWNVMKDHKDAELRIISGAIPRGYFTHNATSLGGVDEQTKLSEYHKCSILCLPSVEDGFGLVVLEAMSCGRPVVISENVGAKDAVVHGYNGCVISARGSEAIKHSLDYLYNKRLILHSMGEAARHTAEKFTWDEYKRKFLEVVENA